METATSSNSSCYNHKRRLSRHEQKQLKRNRIKEQLQYSSGHHHEERMCKTATIPTSSRTLKNKNHSHAKATSQLIYQDIMNKYIYNNKDRQQYHTGYLDDNARTDDDIINHHSDNNNVSDAFFELANATIVKYRIRSNKTKTKKKTTYPSSLRIATKTTTTTTTKTTNCDSQGQICFDHENDNKFAIIGKNCDGILPHSSKNDVVDNDDDDNDYLVFIQDVTACGMHTGGIIWETSYLLLQYLLAIHSDASTTTNHQYKMNDTPIQQNQQQQQQSRHHVIGGNVLEVGSGCGFLGIVLSTLLMTSIQSMTCTEIEPVLSNLCINLKNNESIRKKHNTSSSSTTSVVQCCHLDWTNREYDINQSNGMLQSHSYDYVFGTDVLFTPTLVEPLIQTLVWAIHKQSIVYICVQIRCYDSHTLFQQLIREGQYQHVLQLEEIIDYHIQYPQLQWGKQLECIIYRITKKQNVNEKKQKRAKHRSRSIELK